MPGGQREERLREWVRRRLKARRGTAAKLAEYLDRPSSWMTAYTKGERDADLDTSIAMGRFLQAPWGAIIGDEPLPKPEPAVDERPAVRAAVRVVADLAPRLSDDQLKILIHTTEQFARVAPPIEDPTPASLARRKTAPRSR